MKVSDSIFGKEMKFCIFVIKKEIFSDLILCKTHLYNSIGVIDLVVWVLLVFLPT